MKKIQVVFAAAALLLAVAGVFANTLNTIQFYEASAHSLTGPRCNVPIVDPGCSGTITQCFRTVSVEGESKKIYFSKAELDNQGVIIPNTCVVVLRAAL